MVEVIHHIRPINPIHCYHIAHNLLPGYRVLLHLSLFKHDADLLHPMQFVMMYPRHQSAVAVKRQNKLHRLHSQSVSIQKPVAVFHPCADICKGHEPGHIGICLFPFRFIVLIFLYLCIIRDVIVIIRHRRRFQVGTLTVCQQIQVPDVFIKPQRVSVKALVKNGVGLFHLILIRCRNVCSAV